MSQHGPSRPKLIVSVLSWNAPRYLANLLDNLAHAPPSLTMPFNVVVLDQGNAEDTRSVLRQRESVYSQWLTPLYSDVNHGFSGGHNVVFDHVWQRSRFDYFAVVNQDVLFNKAGWCDDLITATRIQPNVAISGPVAHAINYERGVFERRRPDELSGGQAFIEASIALMRTDVVCKAGLFDEEFHPAYYEDADLCCRYRALGWNMGIAPVAHVHQYLGTDKHSASRKKLEADHPDWVSTNRDLFFGRWSSPAPLTAGDVRSVFPKVYFPRSP